MIYNFQIKKHIFTVIFTFFIAFSAIAQQQIWTRWEKSFSVLGDIGENPITVDFKATFTSQTGQNFTVTGFWDSGNIFKLRTAFPSDGNWTYSTSSSTSGITGLNGQTGTVSVVSYSGQNKLYKNGFLKANGRYISYDNGVPFQWMGCTAWNSMMANDLDWANYINDRENKKFNVIQTCAFVNWITPVKDVNNDTPFINGNTLRPNSVFWNKLDKKINYANDKGLVVLLAGLHVNIPESQYTAYCNYVAARYAGNFIIFSPNGDLGKDPKFNVMGNSLNAATSRHMITQHVGTTADNPDHYYNENYLDFSSNQSGHRQSSGVNKALPRESAILWNLDLYGKPNPKPVINIEAFYEGESSANNTAFKGTAYDARATGWLSRLCGSMGFGYGALGLWNWNYNFGIAGVSLNNNSALNLSSSTHMKYMYVFFDALEWHKLVPKYNKIVGNSSSYLNKSVYSVASDGSFGVAYLPETISNVKLNLTDFASTNIVAKWYNPRTGVYINQTGVYTKTSTSTTFTRPENNGDWVLLLKSSNENPVVINTNAYSQIEANISTTDKSQGVFINNNTVINGMYSGSWIKYPNVDFGTTAASGVELLLSRELSTLGTGIIELRLGAPSGTNSILVGSLNVQNTTNWDTFVTQSAVLSNSAAAIGIKDLYIVGGGPVGTVMADVDWIKFNRGTIVAPIEYTLTVTNGTGSGSYPSGTSVNIVANPAPAGQVFDKWTGNTSGIANLNALNTTISIASAASIIATYKLIPLVSTLDAYIQIEADKISSKSSGVTINTRTIVEGIFSASWIKYPNVDFGSTAASSVDILLSRAAIGVTTGIIELRLGAASGANSVLIGTLVVQNTINWDTFTIQSVILSDTASAIGIKDLYLVGGGSAGTVAADIDWVKFQRTSSAKAQITTDNETNIKAYPNPCTSDLSLMYNENVTADIYNIKGLYITSVKLIANIEKNILIDTLKPGYYVIRIGKDSKIFIKK